MGDFYINEHEMASIKEKAESGTLSEEEKAQIVNKFMNNVSNNVSVGKMIVKFTQPQGERGETFKNALNGLEESVNAAWRWSWPGAVTGAVLGGPAGYFAFGASSAAVATAKAVGLTCAYAPPLLAVAAGVIVFLIVGGLIGGKLAQLLSTIVERLSAVEVSFKNLFHANSFAGVKVSFN